MSEKLDCDFQTAIYALQDWYKLPRTGHNQRNNLRAGQYIWNMHGRDNESWPELYYCENPEHVYSILYKEFH